MHEKTAQLKERVLRFIQSNTPIEANGKITTLSNLSIKDPDNADSIKKQLDMKYLSSDELKSGAGSLISWVRGKIVIKDKKTGTVLSESGVMNLFPIPYLTDRGTYMINGGEKSVLNQMRLKPGAYTTLSENSNEVKTNITFNNSRTGGTYTPQISVRYNPQDGTFKFKISRGSAVTEFNGVSFLRELGFSDTQIKQYLGNNHIADEVMRIQASRQSKSIQTIFKAIVGRDTKENSPEKIRHELFEFLLNNATFGSGTTGVKETLGVKADYLSRDVIGAAVKKTFAVGSGETKQDDKDDLRFKDVYNDSDFIMEEIEKDFETFKAGAVDNMQQKSDEVTYTRIKGATNLGNRSSVFKFMTTSDLSQNPEETNPLFIAAMDKKVTQLGQNGLNKRAVGAGSRNLSSNSFGRIDPIETPESGSIGVVEHLSQNASVKDGTIMAKLYKVRDGKADTNSKNMIEMSPSEEMHHKIAFFDSRYVEKSNGKLLLKGAEVPARYEGKTLMINPRDIEYIDTAAQNIMGFASNLIPFVSHDDGNRALMGANMQKQALLLRNREKPLVGIAHESGKTYEQIVGEQFGKPVKSNVNGTIDKVEDGKITIKDSDGNKHEHEFYHYFPLNQSFIHNELKVKAGDAVKAGDVLAEGWHTKDGHLALGVNTRIGYMPYKGYNYEDGVVVREGYSNKMATEEMQTVDIEIPEGYVGGKGSGIGGPNGELARYTKRAEVFTKLDKDGIIKVGEQVKPGDILVSRLRDTGRNSGGDEDAIMAKKKGSTRYKHDPWTIPATSYIEGKVVRVTTSGSGSNQKITVTLSNSKPLKFGDKIAGRHGNKGTVTKVLPDDEMPIGEDGKPLDLIFSPLAVPSRKNLGQLYETHAGLLAEKTGKSFTVHNFDHTEKDRVMDGLKEIGLPDGKMKVFLREKQADGTIQKVEVENPVTVGNMYIMKLKHKVDDKIQGRSNIEGGAPEIRTNMPSKQVGSKQGERHNPQSLGEMEMRALQAHGAVWNLLESNTIKADGGGDSKQRVAIFNALSTGKLDGLDVSANPETVKVMSDHLQALGLKVTPVHNGKDVKSLDDVHDGLKLTPMKPLEVLKIIGRENEVTSAIPKNLKIDSDKDEFIKGGLLDPEIFGNDRDSESRKKWGYIKLHTPVPNPILLKSKSHNPYVALTGHKADSLAGVMEGKKVLVVDPDKHDFSDIEDEEAKNIFRGHYKEALSKAGLTPGQLIEPQVLEKLMADHGDILFKTGGEAIKHMLDEVDFGAKLKEAKAELDSATGKNIDAAYKKFKALSSLKENKIEPSELMLHYIPVAPLYMRPIIQEGKNITKDKLNDLYSSIVLQSNTLRNKYKDGELMSKTENPTVAARDAAALFKTITNLSGHTVAKDRNTGKEIQGFKTRLGSKEGFVRSKMMSKREDFSGRSVIGVDPTLKLNEAGVPVDMAKYIYRPFILKELYGQGKAKNMDEAKSKWEKLDDDTVKIIHEVSADRPILLNRQPTLHKFSIQAFSPKILPRSTVGGALRSIQLNPLVVTGFNADFDGDQMAIHVPVSEKAKDEAKKLMMPSDNLVNPTNGSIVVEIRHEMALGIYYMTAGFDKPIGKGLPYTDVKLMRKDFLNGAIKARTKVTFLVQPFKDLTAGQALFLSLLPLQYRGNTLKAWSSRDIQQLLRTLYSDAEAGKNGMSKQKVSIIIDSIKELGFLAATKAGASIGVNDFKKVDIKDRADKYALKMIRDEKMSPDEAKIMGWKKAEDEIQDELKAGKHLSDDSPVKLMMVSGARAKADQIRRMMVSVGVGMDLNKNLTQPVESSHLDGLAPQEYWLHAHDSRKGMADRSVSTEKPGALTREIWSATQDRIITENDCHTTGFINLKSSDSSVAGRVAAKDIVDENGKVYCKAGQIITASERNDFMKKVPVVSVRSPLRCKAVGGVCRKCYGTIPGTNQLPDIGMAVGTIASQAMGEPVMQMTMNTFHSGGTSSNATLGLPRIEQLLNLSEDKGNNASLATVSGEVTNILSDKGSMHDIVFIDKKPHKIPKISNGQSQKLRVKTGDKISKGDFITFGNVDDIESGDHHIILTNANPKKLFEFKRDVIGEEGAINHVQDYLSHSMQYAISSALNDNNAIDRRHIETIVSKMTSKAKIVDAGDSNFTKGEVVDRAVIDRWNSENGTPYSSKSVSIAVTPKKAIDRVCADNYKDRKGVAIAKKGQDITPVIVGNLLAAGFKDIKIMPKLIQYEGQLDSKQTVVTKGHSNWLSNMGYENVYSQLARGATNGQTDKLDDPRSRTMTGKLVNVGEGYNLVNNPKTRDKANSVANKMTNFFGDMKNLFK